MLGFADITELLRLWVANASGVGAANVYWQDQAAPQPGGLFATMKIDGPRIIGNHSKNPVSGTDSTTIITSFLAEFTTSIQVFGPGAGVAVGKVRKAYKIQSQRAGLYRRQVESIDVSTVAPLTAYSIVVDGATALYTSLAATSKAAIVAGLVAAVNALSGAAKAVAGIGCDISVSSRLLGTQFVLSVSMLDIAESVSGFSIAIFRDNGIINLGQLLDAGSRERVQIDLFCRSAIYEQSTTQTIESVDIVGTINETTTTITVGS